MDIFGFFGTWFGYVGACVVAPDATCRPLLAFVALGAAAGAALTLVLLACRNAYARERAELEERRALGRAAEVQERLQRSLADRAAVKPVLQGRLRAAA
jgi:hypothetical protein